MTDEHSRSSEWIAWMRDYRSRTGNLVRLQLSTILSMDDPLANINILFTLIFFVIRHLYRA